MIKNIIFDVGNVLVSFDWEGVFQKLGFQGELYQRVADATVCSQLWNEYDRSKMSDQEILEGMISKNPDLESEIRLVWEHNGDMISLFPYACDWVQEFRDKGYGCYILSNYSKRTYELTKAELPFESLMDGVIFSYQVQEIKPEPGIYQRLLEKYALKPEECVFLDDNPANIKAARALGIEAILFHDLQQAKDELVELGIR